MNKTPTKVACALNLGSYARWIDTYSAAKVENVCDVAYNDTDERLPEVVPHEKCGNGQEEPIAELGTIYTTEVALEAGHTKDGKRHTFTIVYEVVKI